jgi:Uri superfamily endonuclease
MTNGRGIPIDGPYEDARTTSGIYCLVLWVPRASTVRLSRAGACRVHRGWYVYTGSAKRSLVPRLLRHLRRRKRFHWHVDHLRAVASVRQIWVWRWAPGAECRTGAMVRCMPGAGIPIEGFGASDCRCVSHLVSFPSEPVPPEQGAPLYICRVRRGRITGARKGEDDGSGLVSKTGLWQARGRAGLTPSGMRRIVYPVPRAHRRQRS